MPEFGEIGICPAADFGELLSSNAEIKLFLKKLKIFTVQKMLNL